jgi:hypothetical protein
MAALLKGTSLEPHTVRLLAMLLQEDGTLTAERRHDCVRGVCYAVGIQGHSICARGTPLVAVAAGRDHKRYCTWKAGKSPLQQFEEDNPEFANNWVFQFEEYTFRMKQCIDSGKSVDTCIQSWNSKEYNRIGKVAAREPLVRRALNL